MTNDLLDCPFCGGPAESQTIIEPSREMPCSFEVIRCSRCKCTTPELEHLDKDQDPFDELKKIWNRRLVPINRTAISHINSLEKEYDNLTIEVIKLKYVLAKSSQSCIYCHKSAEEMNTCSDPMGCERKNDINRYEKG